MRKEDNGVPDDRLLRSYLLGATSPEEAAHVEALGIAEDNVAERLCAIENDLVDAYVRNELAGQDLERFKLLYLSVAKRRRKVEFAAFLHLLTSSAPSVKS
ncbi:MAG TPA: hypothetical protein VFT65_17760 [Candidatus Angelobacter sp.]|nr:hypothetical protein [Candidatus Angelobacter sp.]